MNNNDEFRYDKAYQERLMREFKQQEPEWTRLKIWLIVCAASLGWMVAVVVALLRK